MLSLAAAATHYHGSAFEFVRNDKLDARNYLLTDQSETALQQLRLELQWTNQERQVLLLAGQEYKLHPAVIHRAQPPELAHPRGECWVIFSARAGTLNVPGRLSTAIQPGDRLASGGRSATIPGRNLANLRLNGNPVVISADGKAIAGVFSAMEKLAVSYVTHRPPATRVFQQPNPLTYREDNVRLDYRFNEKHSITGATFAIMVT